MTSSIKIKCHGKTAKQHDESSETPSCRPGCVNDNGCLFGLFIFFVFCFFFTSLKWDFLDCVTMNKIVDLDIFSVEILIQIFFFKDCTLKYVLKYNNK